MTFSALSIINCSYLVAGRPLQDKKAQNIEIFNEMTIYVCSLFVTTLINVAIPLHFKDVLGWVIMGVATFNIVVNLALIIIGSISECIT